MKAKQFIVLLWCAATLAIATWRFASGGFALPIHWFFQAALWGLYLGVFVWMVWATFWR